MIPQEEVLKDGGGRGWDSERVGAELASEHLSALIDSQVQRDGGAEAARRGT
jgi:hypothetical protein